MATDMETREAEMAEALARAAGGDAAFSDTMDMLAELRRSGVTRPTYNLASSYGAGLDHCRGVDDGS